ncbi:MAG: ComEC/Rec2 family competence protein [Verrucomicrobiae bacterium]|nr:ComEC/Rec2 family competence protein [Verrucomicrobiae bacterium]
MRKAPLLILALAAGSGIVLADTDLAWMAGFAAGTGFLGALWMRKRNRALAILIAGTVTALLLFEWRQETRLSHIHGFPLASELARGDELRLRGEGWISGPVEMGSRSSRSTLRLERLFLGDKEVSCSHAVPVWIQKTGNELVYGTEVQFSGRLVPLEPAKVPGGFDAREFYFRESGSLAKLEIDEGDLFEIGERRRGWPIVRSAFALRSRLEEALLVGVPQVYEPYARLVAAMALGAREHSPEELEEFFRISGTMHLFAVSGLHVGIVAGLLAGTASLLGIPKSRAALFIIPSVLFYAVLTGLSPSAVRASLMASVFFGGFLLREQPRLLNSLGFAALLLLAWDPQQLFLPGFQLSFAVLAAIAILAPALGDLMARPFLSDPFLPRSLIGPTRRVVDRFAGALAILCAVSIASWLGSSGLLAWHFQSVSPVGLIANVIMVPIATLMMGIAAISLTSHALHLLWAASLANRLNALVSLGLTTMAQGFASLPGATVHTGRPTIPPGETFRLEVMGVRGEAAAFLEIPRTTEGRPLRWVIDSGGNRTYESRLLPLLRSRGVNRVDALVLTHGDEGHLGAASALITQFRPELLLESALENRSPAYPEIINTAYRLGTRTIPLEQGQRMHLPENTSLTVLHPSSLRPGRLADDRALVLRIEHAGRVLLLTSDSGFETERSLIESGIDLKADLWIRGQHRESPSGLTAFVDSISPRAVISTHADFPQAERIPPALREHLRLKGIPLYDLESTGTVSIQISPSGIRVAPHSGPIGLTMIPHPDSKQISKRPEKNP